MDEWKEKLDPDAYAVLRKKGTERAFTGKYWNHKGAGMYRCAGCGQALFSSEAKFDSGSGWPSFTEAMPTSVELQDDRSLLMKRTEVLCSKCQGHLGHVFDDGPSPSRKRFCINSAALSFEEKK